MEWWRIVILAAIVAVAGVAGEVYLRLAPQRERRNEQRRQLLKAIKDQLEGYVTKVKAYRSIGLHHLEEASNNAYISTKCRKALTSIIDIGKEYDDWRHECFQVIKSEVTALGKQFSTLNDVFSLVFGSDLDGVFSGTEGSASYGIYKAIYKGELTFDMAKELILKDNWDREVVTQGKNVMFKDTIDGADFHKFIESLRKLQNRTSIKTLRNAQAIFLQKARSVSKEVL